MPSSLVFQRRTVFLFMLVKGITDRCFVSFVSLYSFLFVSKRKLCHRIIKRFYLCHCCCDELAYFKFGGGKKNSNGFYKIFHRTLFGALHLTTKGQAYLSLSMHLFTYSYLIFFHVSKRDNNDCLSVWTVPRSFLK